MTELFQIYDNVVDKELINLFYKYTLESNAWAFGRRANPNDMQFWGQQLYEHPGPQNFFVNYLEQKFRSLTNIHFITNSAYLNGQTSNQQGGWHTDISYDSSGEPVPFPINNFLTLIYYVNSSWDDKRGSTILKKSDGTDIEVQFVPGRILVFPSNWQHYGDCPEQSNLLRITCALKLQIIKDDK